MTKDIITSQVQLYRQQFLEHGDTPNGTFNQSESIQTLRFTQLLNPLQLENATLHDVGCGICDLYHHVSGRFDSLTYSGTEIVPEMVTLARSKYPALAILQRDIINDSVPDCYDYVVQSGVFNLPGEQDIDSWRLFTRSFITQMFKMSTKAISFNFLNAQVAQYHHPDMYYEMPSQILEYCTSHLSRFCLVNHSYPLYEFTVTVFKDEYVKSLFPDQTFSRYFG